MLNYLRYFGTHVLLLVTMAGLLAGGAWYWAGLAAGVVIWIGGDAFSLRVGPTPRYRHEVVLDLALYSLFPPLVVLAVLYAWTLSPGDLFGIGAWVSRTGGYDAITARGRAGPLDYLGAAWSFALTVALAGILVAHELVHRTRDRLAMWVGRWQLAIAFNASLEIAHVFGHHSEVGTPVDPATARRGENVYHFFIRSTVGQVFQAWRIESARLADRPKAMRILANRVVHGFLRSGLVAGLFFAAGGAFALGMFLLASLYNKLLLEALNYMEHYGLVRVPGTPIEQRHSWNSHSAFSHAVLFNLPYHADHHARAGVHYPALHGSDAAPVLGRGYLATLPLVLVPPLWRRLIAPRLARWDALQATPAERALLPGSN